MTNYATMANRQRSWMFYALAISVAGWGFTDYENVFAGLILGLVIGLFNLFLLQKRVDVIGEKAANNQAAKSFGTLSRFAAAILVVVIIMRFPEHFNLLAGIIGLMTPYIVIMIDFIFHHKETTTTKRGE